MSRIIIADVRSHATDGTIKGHGYAVASNYLQIFKGTAEVKAAGGPAYARKYGEDCVELPYDTSNSTPGWLNKLRVLLNMRALFRRCRRDTIVLQSSGVATALVGLWLFKPADTRVFMILYNADAVASRLKRCLFRLAKKHICGVLCPNESVGRAHDRAYCVVPDYIYCAEQETSEAHPLIPYAEKTYDFCMVGLIWRDKGMVEVARHLAGTPYKVLIAGGLSGEEGLEEDLRAACRGAENIDLRIGYLSAEEYDAAIRSGRYSILNYSGAYSHHSSGVVFDIIFRGVPVIGSRCRALQFIEEDGIGRTFSDIQDFRPSEVLQESVHHRFVAALQTYYHKHQEYRKKLMAFVGVR